MDLDNSIEKTIINLQKLMNTDSIIGKPISTPDKVVIPISKAALGFGVGVGSKNGNNESNLGGAGGGGSVDPIALLIIYNNIPGPEGVELVRIDEMDTPIEDLLSGVGKVLFDFLGNNKSSSKNVPVESEGNIEKIKTKIKPKTDNKKSGSNKSNE